MKNKKTQKALKTYSFIGKSLCACAGGIIGFIAGGPFLTIPGIVLGITSGHLLEKNITS